MLDNAILEACGRETLSYRSMVRWAYAFHRGREDVHQCHTTIIVVEQSVRRSLQEDAMDGIRRLPDVRKRVLYVGGDYFLALKQCDCSKIFFIINSNVATN